MVHALGGEVAHPCRRRIIADPLRLKVDPSQILARAEPGGSEGVERGGLGGDPPAASGRADVDQADRQVMGLLQEHHQASLGGRGAAALPAGGSWVGRGRGRATHPGVAASVTDDAGHGGRRADRLDPLADGAQGSGAGAAAYRSLSQASSVTCKYGRPASRGRYGRLLLGMLGSATFSVIGPTPRGSETPSQKG
jgi:hypothetical protein